MNVLENEISLSIIEAIDEESWEIIALNNDITPFNVVFYVLKSVVPLEEEIAYQKTMDIHFFGEAAVYKGSRDHCEKIGEALHKIQVDYRIVC